MAGVLLAGQGEHRASCLAPRDLPGAPLESWEEDCGWVFLHSFVSLPVLWLRQGAAGGSHGGYCSRLRGHWDAVPCPSPAQLHLPGPTRVEISPALSFLWKQGAFPGGSASSPHHVAFSHGYPSSCQFVSIYLPSSISLTLSRFLSNEFIHCWAQDKMNSHREQAGRGCCRKHLLLSPLLP